MKWNYIKILSLILFFSIFTFATFFVENSEKKKASNLIGIEKAYEVFNQGNCFFVDARSFEEFAKGHIEGALNIPFNSDKKIDYIFKAIDILNEAKFVVVYCNGEDCGLSKMLAKDLINAGLKEEKLLIFTEGYDLWKKKGYPVSRDLSFQEALFGQSEQ